MSVDLGPGAAAGSEALPKELVAFFAAHGLSKKAEKIIKLTGIESVDDLKLLDEDEVIKECGLKMITKKKFQRAMAALKSPKAEGNAPPAVEDDVTSWSKVLTGSTVGDRILTWFIHAFFIFVVMSEPDFYYVAAREGWLRSSGLSWLQRGLIRAFGMGMSTLFIVARLHAFGYFVSEILYKKVPFIS